MRTSVVARLVVMALLMVGLLIPLSMVQGVVSERATRRDSAAAEVSGVWGGAHTFGGPVLTVPYRYTVTDNSGRQRSVTGRAHYLPDQLQIVGRVEPEIRRRSLVEVVVYRAHLEIAGRFAPPDFAAVRPAPEEIQWDRATVSLGVSDPRGISRRAVLTWDGQSHPFIAGVADVVVFPTGVQAPVRVLTPASSQPLAFRLAIDVNGTREIKFLPSAGETSVQLTSSWPHPSFVGGPLPESREIQAAGFSATWRAPDFGRGYPPIWTSADATREQLPARAQASAFGVGLIRPVDIYQQAERAVKYGALFIVPTFLVFFLWEIFQAGLLHPLQYLFVGFALCVFYLLLVSLSEHVGFDPAYVAAAGATVSLVGGYSRYVLGGLVQGGLMAVALAVLYGFLYLLLRLEDYALLAGSIGLFLMLALLMFLTRRVDWYELRLGTR